MDLFHCCILPHIIDSKKSTTQKTGDSTRSGADDAQNDGKGILQSAKETTGNVAGKAADKLKAASEYCLVGLLF